MNICRIIHPKVKNFFRNKNFIKIFKRIAIAYRITLLTVTFFWAISSLAINIEQVKKDRQNQSKGFLSSFNNIQSCKEKLNNLSQQVSAIKKDVYEKQDLYKNIRTEEAFQKTFKLRTQNLNSIKAIETEMLSLKKICPFFRFDSLVSNLDLTIKDLKQDQWSMNYDQDWIKTDKKISERVHNDSKLRSCDINMGGPTQDIIILSFFMSLNDSNGDIFELNKNFSFLKILDDYISTTATVCGLKEAIETVDSLDEENKKIRKAEIKSFQSSLDAGQKMLTEGKEILNGFSFEESSKKICRKLRDSEKDHAGVCENPLDNPSWHYSVSYFLNTE